MREEEPTLRVRSPRLRSGQAGQARALSVGALLTDAERALIPV